jgi:hypothetical protein
MVLVEKEQQTQAFWVQFESQDTARLIFGGRRTTKAVAQGIQNPGKNCMRLLMAMVGHHMEVLHTFGYVRVHRQ